VLGEATLGWISVPRSNRSIFISFIGISDKRHFAMWAKRTSPRNEKTRTKMARALSRKKGLLWPLLQRKKSKKCFEAM
jgi:hypothetical protein